MSAVDETVFTAVVADTDEATTTTTTSTATAASAPIGTSSSVKKYTSFREYTAHEEMNPKRRSTMEDCYRVLPDLFKDNNAYTDTQSLFSYFGVYDGHGGRQIVDFLDDALEKSIINELLLQDDANIPMRLVRAFLITDMQSRQLNITTSGATAVCCLLKHDKTSNSRILYSANVGDSRSVLVGQRGDAAEECENAKGYYASRLSYDHRADDLNEQKRIKEAGGFVTRSRVLGILAVSRSFGDHGMKDFVTANPHISETHLAHDCEYPLLIIACDGVWDVFTDQEAADLLMIHYKQRGECPFNDAAQILVNAAIERGSMDNVTALVVFL